MSCFNAWSRSVALLSGWMALAGIMTATAGCSPKASNQLVIATNWPPAERSRLVSEFQTRLGLTGAKRIDVDWLFLEPGDDVHRLIAGRYSPDVLLGIRASVLARLETEGSLSPIRCIDSKPWARVRRAGDETPAQGLPVQSQSMADELAPTAIAIGDPRSDAISLGWASGQLDGGRFLEGYSRLVRIAANPRRIPRHSESTLTASVLPPIQRNEGSEVSAQTAEGIAIPRSAAHQESAQEFLQCLADRHRLGAYSDITSSGTDSDVDTLLAELLGATLVDAQDELWTAWVALQRRDYPPTALKWMTEPPPWPPASITKILNEPGANGMSLVETLAREIAPEPPVRAWLMRSWLSRPGLIDETVLKELVQAVDGRLFREPRFRAWLRAEWTAWARQRYRRVLRIAGS
jgi:hypothetical protein